jgi:hypothetical protein
LYGFKACQGQAVVSFSKTFKITWKLFKLWCLKLNEICQNFKLRYIEVKFAKWKHIHNQLLFIIVSCVKYDIILQFTNLFVLKKNIIYIFVSYSGEILYIRLNLDYYPETRYIISSNAPPKLIPSLSELYSWLTIYQKWFVFVSVQLQTFHLCLDTCSIICLTG